MARPSGKPRAGERQATERVVGLAAARAVLASRPRDVLNIAHSPEARKELAELLREAARQRIAYREVDKDELARMADTVHHEGVCLLVKARSARTLDDVREACAESGLVLALDGIENPHNIGALMRTAAYFGVRALLVGGGEQRLSPATVRVAEGGAEVLPVCFVPELDKALALLASHGLPVIGADAHDGVALAGFTWPARCVLVLGSERHGLSKNVRARCTKRVRIEGTGAVESLNVSVAAGVLVASAAHAQQRRQ